METLFESAKKNGGIEYIYTLVRVDGITCKMMDPLIKLRSLLQMEKPKDNLLLSYCALANEHAPLALVANLLYCSSGKPYNIDPFHILLTKKETIGKHFIREAIINYLVELARNAGFNEISSLIKKAYPPDVIQYCSAESKPDGIPNISETYNDLHSFLKELLDKYFKERLKYLDQQHYYKLPRFEVLEILTNQEYGLYGINVHFSNGSYAAFIRDVDSTEATNIIFDCPINFMVGDIGRLKNEYIVGEKRLYEIGLPGRYNKLGEWRPIIYPGDSSHLEKEAIGFSDDADVQGALFYMLCTGHRIIEFVALSSIELPQQTVSFGEYFHLWKCPPLNDAENFCAYDGWIELTSTQLDDLKYAIAMIGIGVNRMAFAYGGTATWRVKYRIINSMGGCATPSIADLHVLDSILRQFPKSDDASILDNAIDWYNRGRNARDIFTSFLCYYIAFESIVAAITNGDADLGLGYHKEDKATRNKYTIKCIEDKHKNIYSEDPIKFIKDAYFDCVLSLAKKAQLVAELVFGKNHKFIEIIPTLNDIRSRLAHGRSKIFNTEEWSLVNEHLHVVEEMSREFLTRTIFLLKPGESLSNWSQHHKLSISGSDPRTILVVNDERMLPTKDWRIRPEWID